MVNLISMFCESKNNTNEEDLENLWGDSWNKLTLKQRQLVKEILSRGKISQATVCCHTTAGKLI